MKTTLSRLLIEAAQADPKVMVLTGDHGYGLFKDFRRECPRQFLNCGIAEQNMIGVAAGLARQGFKPIVYALAAFMPCRVVEQIKLDLCYPNLPVILIGDGAGLVYSYLGPSHHACEDVALLRSLPNITIDAPHDRKDLESVFKLALAMNGPTYLRLGKSDRGDALIVYDEAPAPDVMILATGSMVKTATDAAKLLGRVWVEPVTRLKPLTLNDEVLEWLGDTSKHVFILEEHSAIGGLGSAVAEKLAEMDMPMPRLLRLGVPDAFRHTAGTWEYQMRECGLDTESVVRRIKEALCES